MSPEPARRPPWPADRWPTADELLEFCRVTRTDEVRPLLEQMIAHGRRGQHCLVADHEALFATRDNAVRAHVDTLALLERARLAHRGARGRAAQWRRMAVAMAEAAIPDPDGDVPDEVLELASAIALQDAGFSVDRVEVASFGGRRIRTVQTTDLLARLEADQ